MNRSFCLGTLIWLTTVPPLFAQIDVPLDPATAGFIYFPSAEGPGIPGGVPNPYQLHFGLQGMFRIEHQPVDVAKITQANFVLVGNDAAFQNDPQARAELELRARETLLSAIFDIEVGPPLDRTVYRAPFPFGPDLEIEFFRQTLVRMAGGPDSTPIDGVGLRYVYPIPEPATVTLLVAACTGGGLWVIVRRRRPCTPR
jgi:hypothetical protein